MITITTATLEQAPIVHRIMIEAFAEYLGVLEPPSGAHGETVADVLDVMSRGGAVIAWDEGTPVGSGRWIFEPDHVYVGRLSVLPPYRSQGIASAMLAFVEAIAEERGYRQMRLGVRMVLERNLSMYQRAGYTIVEIVKHERGDAQVAYLEKHFSARQTD